MPAGSDHESGSFAALWASRQMHPWSVDADPGFGATPPNSGGTRALLIVLKPYSLVAIELYGRARNRVLRSQTVCGRARSSATSTVLQVIRPRSAAV
jgi:hypothetical protein